MAREHGLLVYLDLYADRSYSTDVPFVIKLGVEAEFHVRYSDIEKARLFASKFDQKMNEIKGYLGRNQSATNRTKSLFEINASQSGNHTLNSTNNDYLGLGLGGYY